MERYAMKPDHITLTKLTETIRDMLLAKPPKFIQYKNRVSAWRNSTADFGRTKNPEIRSALSSFAT